MHITVQLPAPNFSCHFIALSLNFTTLNKLYNQTWLPHCYCAFQSFTNMLNGKGPNTNLMEPCLSLPSTANTNHLVFQLSNHTRIFPFMRWCWVFLAGLGYKNPTVCFLNFGFKFQCLCIHKFACQSGEFLSIIRLWF